MPSLVLSVRFSLFLLLALAVPFVSGCDTAETSLYDPDAPTNAAPVVESVSPSGVVLAGIDEITISGRNFSATASDNIVTFDDGLGASAAATVLEASPTMLRVRVPNLPNAALRLRVSVLGSPDFSATVTLPLAPAFLPFGNLDKGIQEEPKGIVGDGTGALIVSVAQNGNPRNIQRFTPDGMRQPYVTTAFTWTDLAQMADGMLVGARGIQAVFGLPRAGAQQTIRPVLPASVRLNAVDIDDEGNLWVAGAAGTATAPVTPNIYRFSGGAAVPTPFLGEVSDLKVANGALYVAAVRAQEGKVWRLPIRTDGTLGAEAIVYTAEPDTRPSALAFAADGTLFVSLVPTQGSRPAGRSKPNCRSDA